MEGGIYPPPPPLQCKIIILLLSMMSQIAIKVKSPSGQSWVLHCRLWISLYMRVKWAVFSKCKLATNLHHWVIVGDLTFNHDAVITSWNVNFILGQILTCYYSVNLKRNVNTASGSQYVFMGELLHYKLFSH